MIHDLSTFKFDVQMLLLGKDNPCYISVTYPSAINVGVSWSPSHIASGTEETAHHTKARFTIHPKAYFVNATISTHLDNSTIQCHRMYAS